MMKSINKFILLFMLLFVCLLSAEIQYETVKFVAEDANQGDSFGCSVSLANSFMIAGARLNSDDGWGAGCAYIFQRVGNSWQQDIKLNANDGSAYSFYGTSVAVSGELAVVGAPGHNTSGRVYVYRFSSNQWSFEAMLTASDASSFNYDSFGQSVHSNGGKIIVGAPGKNFSQGSVYIFSRSGNSWEEEVILTAVDGEVADSFGCSVHLNGVYAVVGAKGDDDNGQAAGTVYVYRKVNGNWEEDTKLLAEDGEEDDWLGFSVSMNANKIMAGAQNLNQDFPNQGGAYIWEWDGTAWTEQIKLLASDADSEDSFGISSLYGNFALAGAYKDDDNGENSGSAYLYYWHNNSWEEVTKCLASDGSDEDNLGSSLYLFENSAAIGAPNHNNSGAVYIYDFEASSLEYSELSLPELMLQNYPNPFNPETEIRFQTSENSFQESDVRIEIYNLKGQKIKTLSVTLSDSSMMNSIEGSDLEYSVIWNGTDQNNHPVPSGIYFYKLKSGNTGKVRKMVLLK